MANKNWYQRNKKWFLPTVIIGPLLLMGCFVLVIITFVTSMMKNSEAYKMTMEEIKSNKECVAALGENIEDGYFIRGNINTTTSSGNANMYIPLKGDLGEATAHSICEREWFKWKIIDLNVKVGDKIIDIK